MRSPPACSNKQRLHSTTLLALAKLHIPTLIVQGRQDPLDPEMASEARDAIPGAKLIILERAGHFSWLDNPTDFNAAVQPFLAAQ